MNTPYAELKRDNQMLSSREYSAGLIHLQSLPRALFIELTQGCNLKCPMCRADIIAPHSAQMSDALFDKIAESLFATAELVDLRGWGESLILPDILVRIEAVRRYEAALRIVTNLSFRRDEVLNALVDANASIDFSLDTSDPALLAAIRSGSRLDLISRNVTHILNRFGHPDALTMLVTIQRPTIAKLPELVQYAAELGVRRIRLFSVTAPDDSPLSLAHDAPLLDAALAESAEVASVHGVTLVAGTQLGTMPPNPPDLPTCIHPWAYCYIAFDGSVSFCDHLIGPGNAEYVVGNLNCAEFDDIWNGEGMKRIRSEHTHQRRSTAPQFSHCAWCYRSKYIDFEERFDPALAGSIVRIA